MIATLACVCSALTAFAQSAEPPYVAGELLFQARPGYPVQRLATDLNQRFPGLQAKLVKEVAPPTHIWLLRFDRQADHAAVLAAANAHASVTVAQYNHLIRQRATTPNDPGFAQQWQYINTGAGGGVADADIDADEAWDFTTGGLTPFGDTIVACIIDDGIDSNHPDFGDNRWRNYHEIPNNLIDDDGNGYDDDFDGWNAYNSTDNITGGGHGTPVTGIVGAKGNNGIGVAGVNWNVKLMVVQGGGNEAEAIAAYAYPLAMRKLYNQTNGVKGAFVVVTNASWGTDFGQPSQAPLWCAMYDSLGKYGILSCGATANLNIDIDVDGDLPTACPSDYLIAVTNMNRSDIKVTSAGYGATTIDLGAHGQDTWTTAAGSSYGGFGGTSGATPHVTGAVALLYSVNCGNMAALALSHPDSAARLVKQFILDGTDPNASLAGITVTGGRLNLHKAILQLLSWNCNVTGCYQAFSLRADAVTDTSATLHWSALSSADSFRVELRRQGATAWASVNEASMAHSFDTLQACTVYEYRVASLCDTFPPSFSAISTFKTDGCCLAPTGFTVTFSSATAINISFSPVLAAQSYTVRYRPAGSATAWTLLPNLTTTVVAMTGLDTCTTYEYQVQTVCDTGSTPFSPLATFSTIGCEGCDQPFCTISGTNSSDEWIDRVQFVGINNNSGNNNGYGNFTVTHIAQVATFGSYPVTLTPGYNLFPYDEYFTVYIDYNQDGDFADAGELAYDPGSTTNGTVNGTITIPGSASLGICRMRVIMQFQNPAPGCGPAFDFGEVEDYCVEILQGSVATTPPLADALRAYPNPFSQALNIEFLATGQQDYTLQLIGLDGRAVREHVALHPGQGPFRHAFFTEGLPSGMYFLRLQSAGVHQTLKVNLMK